MAAKAKRSPAQNKRMWGLVHQLVGAGMDRDQANDLLRAITREVSGQEHTSQLGPRQAGTVIDRLDAQLQELLPTTRKPWGPRGDGPRPVVTITPRQQAVISALFQQAGLDTVERQRGFCQRKCRVPWPQTQHHADALMEALQAMILRTVTPAGCLARFERLNEDPRLNAFEEGFVDDLLRQFADADDPAKVMSTHKLQKLMEIEQRLGVA